MLTFTGNAPVAGQSYILHYGPYVQPGSSGAEQTWDLSTLTTDSVDLIDLVDPATTVNTSNFPGATVAETGGDAVMYFRSATDGMYLVGSDASGLLIPYSDEGRYLPFPCSYAQTWTDDVTAQFEAEGMQVFRSGTITGSADGYGTLTMPTWSASDVLRVHWHEETVDSTSLFTFINVYDSYLYFVEGQSCPIVQLVHNEVTFMNQTTVHEHAQWVDELSTASGAIAPAEDGLRLFPVLVHSVLNIALPQSLNEGALLAIIDAQGRTVHVVRAVSNGLAQLDVSGLEPGIYELMATNGKYAQATRRFLAN